MSAQLVTNDHHEAIHDILECADSAIKIISPFIGIKMVKLLCSYLKMKPNLKCEVTTRFKRDDFMSKASSLDALKMLIQAGANVFALRGLHTKLYLIDDKIGMIGSANFSAGGFRYNHEMSVLFENDPVILGEMHAYYNKLLNEIRSQAEGILTLEKVETETENIEKILASKGTNPNGSSDADYGANVPNESKLDIEPTPDTVQEILIAGADNQHTIWIKFEGSASDRIQSSNRYDLLRINNDTDIVTCFPRRPCGIHDGDYIYLAAVSTDKNGRNTPMIMGRCRTYGWKDVNQASPELLKEHAWMVRYPYYCRLKNVEYLDTQIQNGIPLLNLLDKVKSNCFPSTIGTNRTESKELINVYRRGSHRRITVRAKAYLDKQFDERTKVYAVVKIP